MSACGRMMFFPLMKNYTKRLEPKDNIAYLINNISIFSLKSFSIFSVIIIKKVLKLSKQVLFQDVM